MLIGCWNVLLGWLCCYKCVYSGLFRRIALMHFITSAASLSNKHDSIVLMTTQLIIPLLTVSTMSSKARHTYPGHATKLHTVLCRKHLSPTMFPANQTSPGHNHTKIQPLPYLPSNSCTLQPIGYRNIVLVIIQPVNPEQLVHRNLETNGVHP